jgi:hypothetical protein
LLPSKAPDPRIRTDGCRLVKLAGRVKDRRGAGKLANFGVGRDLPDSSGPLPAKALPGAIKNKALALKRNGTFPFPEWAFAENSGSDWI